METKENQIVARQELPPLPFAGEGDADSDDLASGEKGARLRQHDEITLKVPNPLLSRPPAPPPVPPPLPPTISRPPLDARLNHTMTLPWEELSTMPPTPPPLPLPFPQVATPPPRHRAIALLAKHRGVALLVVATAIGAGAAAGVLAFRKDSKPEVVVSRPVMQPEIAPKVAIKEEPVEVVEKRPPAAAPAHVVPSEPAKRHVRITVYHPHASLALDSVVAGGNLIALDIIKDQAPHVVQATAPGYLPFKKSFTIASDVRLDIRLKKAEAPASRVHPGERPSEVVAEPSESAAKPRPAAASAEDFGMDMQRPITRLQTKRIDEKDPYTP